MLRKVTVEGREHKVPHTKTSKFHNKNMHALPPFYKPAKDVTTFIHFNYAVKAFRNPQTIGTEISNRLVSQEYLLCCAAHFVSHLATINYLSAV